MAPQLAASEILDLDVCLCLKGVVQDKGLGKVSIGSSCCQKGKQLSVGNGNYKSAVMLCVIHGNFS